MQITFEAVDEELPGPKWRKRFNSLWPHYQRWYLANGAEQRPTYLQCERAMREHMPELVPTWEKLVNLAGGGDLEARFLSLYCPPPYLTGCSQAVRLNGAPMLVRNYDYSPQLFERLIWRSAWNRRFVLATTDCLIGVLDGMNESGLAVSLSFGGMKEVGTGFGAPVVLRYLLEFCSNVAEAAQALRRIPVHMAYNILVVDRAGDYTTAYTRPDGPTLLHRSPASTNHQDRIAWVRHAAATATLQRERRLFELLGNRALTEDGFIGDFLQAPLHQMSYLKGYGTLYTAVYRPASLRAEYRWPDTRVEFILGNFHEHCIEVDLPEGGKAA